MLSRRKLLHAFAAVQARDLGTAPQPTLKITSVKAYPVALVGRQTLQKPQFRSEFDPARWRWRGPLAQLTGAIVVEVRTDQGITGHGLGSGGGAAAYVIEHHFEHLLRGANPLRAELLWDQMYTASSFYGRRGLVVMALSGVDLALWDIAGKQAGRPVHSLLGGPVKERVPAYYTGHDVEGALRIGFRAFKWPIREGVAEGRDGMKRTIETLRRVRGLIGPDAELMLECGSLWDVPYTLEMCERMAGLRLMFVEEPLLPDDLDGYERLCGEVRGTQIASGEHEYTRFGFQELIRRKAAHVLQPDVTWCGGLSEARRIAALASAASLPLVPHRGGSAYGLHFILATPHCNLAESFGTGESANELMLAMSSRFKNGYYYPSEKPGFGVEITEALLKQHVRQL
jgi:L-rhamnonate dehydratase